MNRGLEADDGASRVTVKFGFVADSAELDSSGKLNVHGIFSSIKATAFPATHPSIALVLRFELPLSEFNVLKDLRIDLVGDDGDVVLAVRGKFIVKFEDPDRKPPPHIEHDQIIPLGNITFPKEGDYAFNILVQDDTKARIPITLIKTENK